MPDGDKNFGGSSFRFSKMMTLHKHDLYIVWKATQVGIRGKISSDNNFPGTVVNTRMI